MKKLKLYISAGIVILLQTCSTYAQEPETHSSNSYTIGVVPQFTVRKTQSIWRPILDHIEHKTGINLVLRGSTNIPGFEKEFIAGNFDFAYMNPYHMLIAQNKQGYIPLVRDKGRKLYGILVVRKDSPVKDIRDLDNKKVAFPAPNALGASLMIRANLKRLFNINITPSYVQTHDSSYLNVVLKSTSAGSGVQKTFNQQKPAIKDKLRILYETEKVSPHPFAVHPRVPGEIRKKIQQVLLDMGTTNEGRELLKKIPMKKAIHWA